MTGEIIFIIHCSTNNAISFLAAVSFESNLNFSLSLPPPSYIRAFRDVHDVLLGTYQARHNYEEDEEEEDDVDVDGVKGKSVFRSSWVVNDIPVCAHLMLHI